MKRKKFRIRKKPIKPKKSDFKGKLYREEIGDSCSADALIPLLQKAIETDPEAYIEADLNYDYCYYESDTPSIVVHLCVKGDSYLYQKAMKEYEANLASYNEWYEKYKTEIEEELRLRELEK